MRYKEEEIELKYVHDLSSEMECPNCGKMLEAPDYKCEQCKCELVFYIKKYD